MRNISDKIYILCSINFFPNIDALLHFHCKNGYTSVPQCSIIHIMPILVYVLLPCTDIFLTKFKQAVPVMKCSV